MKKIFLFASLSLFVPFFVLAALRVPVQVSPLQPIPQNTAPNANANINTPGNAYNASQTQIQDQQNQSQNNTQQNNQVQNNQAAPIVGSISTSSVTFYWFLLIVGVAGLVAAGIWAYLRFVYKSK